MPPAAAPVVAGPGPGEEAPRVRASPSARVAAKELGIRLEAVRGTGPGGAVSREDVERTAAEARARVAPLPAAAPRPAASGMRQAIAAAMARSKREIPHYYLSTRIDLGRALAWLREHNAPLGPAERLLPIALLLRATALAVRKVPELNGYYVDGAFHPGAGVHLGLVISLREGGVVAPALHDVDARSLAALMGDVTDLIERSRRGQLRSSELSDATLTVTSLGERGVESVTGVIFPPQVAIVGFGKVVEVPVVDAGQVVVRPTVVATLAADHRVSDGHRGGLFLAELERLLQAPEAL
ncbi:MAG TPA: dihydrolipoamide acetyltransferase family protein [Aggregicoccus sp.]|nr:dihydrolipoamide acetyltransferase family protein [Aggregicoccus sp.]